jgi:hypothetical protein
MARNICKNCAHFTPETLSSLQGFGSCDMITDAEPSATNLAYAWDYEGYSAGVHVGEKFGCIHFQRKQP